MSHPGLRKVLQFSFLLFCCRFSLGFGGRKNFSRSSRCGMASTGPLPSRSSNRIAVLASLFNDADVLVVDSQGRSIPFFGERQLKKIQISGGPPEPICNVSGFASLGTWGRGGTILFCDGVFWRIYRVPAEGVRQSS
jgi:hypothetical protein